MKIVVVHNFYQQPGGEDQVFQSEVQLLREYGHQVDLFELHNDRVPSMNRLALLGATVWNGQTYQDLRALVASRRTVVVHFHNTFPLVSPAAYYAARDEGAAVVQTLHNYRLLCPGALFYRDGKTCELCLGRAFAWPSILHGCYRESRTVSAVTATAVGIHRAAGTWNKAVDAYITLTDFARGKFVAGGLPEDRIAVKPNFVHPDPGVRAGGGKFAVFVGRLSEEKGIHTLLEAWETLGQEIPLKIIGDGPLADLVKQAMARNDKITWLGRRPLDDIYDVVGSAEFLVFPSRCYETFGRVAVEAFAVGTPVVASGHGAMADVVGDSGLLGRVFRPGDAEDLVVQVRHLRKESPEVLAAMRKRVRDEFETKYAGPHNHDQLIRIYRSAIAQARLPEEQAKAARAASFNKDAASIALHGALKHE
jgi:glycosyltransferase involved in cell wall biosynthesis